MNKLIAFCITSLMALFMVGCDSGSSGGGGGPVCPPGTVFDAATNTCLVVDPGVVPNNTGPVNYYDFNQQFYTTYYGSVQTESGDMTITNTGAYTAFLREAMAICDRGNWTNNGLANCSSWTSGSLYLKVQIDTNLKPSVSFTAQPRMDIFNYYFSAGWDNSGMAFNPLNLTTGNTLSLINHSKGLEIRANGSYMNGGGLRLIQIIVREGTLADKELTYELFYPYNNVATQFATGILKRY